MHDILSSWFLDWYGHSKIVHILHLKFCWYVLWSLFCSMINSLPISLDPFHWNWYTINLCKILNIFAASIMLYDNHHQYKWACSRNNHILPNEDIAFIKRRRGVCMLWIISRPFLSPHFGLSITWVEINFGLVSP